MIDHLIVLMKSDDASVFGSVPDGLQTCEC